MQKLVSVFGGSRATEEHLDYQFAAQIGIHLARQQIGVAVGGHNGLMEAIGKSVSTHGGNTIYVVTDVLRPRDDLIPDWADSIVELPTIYDHMRHLATAYQGVLVLSGGIGTFGEIGLLWTLMQLGEVEKRPCIIASDLWQHILRRMQQHENGRYVNPGHMNYWHYMQNPQQIAETFDEYMQSGQ